MADTPDFDAADLAVAILDLDESVTLDPRPPVPPPAGRPGSAMGWLLVAALVVAVSVAISLAVQLKPETSSPPEPPPCAGLYSGCCLDDDRVWQHCDPQPCDNTDLRDGRDNDGRGLFDAEERFADPQRFDRC